MAADTTKLKTLKPLARSANGKISTVYDTIRGVKAILHENVNTSVRSTNLIGTYSYAAKKRKINAILAWAAEVVPCKLNSAKQTVWEVKNTS